MNKQISSPLDNFVIAADGHLFYVEFRARVVVGRTLSYIGFALPAFFYARSSSLPLLFRYFWKVVLERIQGRGRRRDRSGNVRRQGESYIENYSRRSLASLALQKRYFAEIEH